MAVSLKARHGSSFKTTIRYEDSNGDLIDTTGLTASFQLRAVAPNGRVLLNTQEHSTPLPAPVGTILTRTVPGSWDLFLGKTFVSSLPPTTRWEIELTSNLDPEDSYVIATGVLLVEPEAVV